MRALLLLLLAGCLRTTSYTCHDDGACGANGKCESTGYCSIPDEQCGRRYDSSAGSLAGTCVGGAMVDAPTSDAHATDAHAIDAAPFCDPQLFVEIPGGTAGHRYRKIEVAHKWDDQKIGCAGAMGHAYLAIPNDAAELTALATYLAPTFWIGLHRMGSSQNFETVLNPPTAAPYTPWQGGSPTGGSQNDCVAAVSSTEIQTDSCTPSTQFPAVCECQEAF